MSIRPLPEGTVRRLGSTLVITNPVLLLKELLDNAIDSGATSVDVLVSPNTVDKLEVRDNGRGIRPEDFDCLGRPGHTSKLQSFEELGSIGGSSLGFRGVALASANTLGTVTLTTRVSSEHVGTAISLAREGGVCAQRHVAAPAGTTVTVTGLFSHHPVRLQVTMREAPKSLAEMKELLHAYVLTRPRLRLRFTVLKTPNLSWSYAPSARSGVKEAAMQLFGTDLASQCTFQIFPEAKSKSDNKPPCPEHVPPLSPEPAACLTFEALIPKADADLRKVTRGSFFSVDSRPVSPARGITKKLLSLFRSRIATHFGSEAPKTAFIRLDIRCPPGSYDVNVEPSKDDVLFRDEHNIIDLFETFLASVYPVPDCVGSPQSPTAAPAPDITAPVESAPEVPGNCLLPQAMPPTWRVDMSSGLDGMSDEDGEGNDNEPGAQQRTAKASPIVPEKDDDKESDEQTANEGLNPWSLAKLTGLSRRVEQVPEAPAPESRGQQQLRSPVRDVSCNSNGGFAEAEREPLAGGSFEPHPGRRNPVRNAASHGRTLRDVFEHAPRTAPSRSARLRNRHSQSRRNPGLQSPPTSSPLEYEYHETGHGAHLYTRYPASRAHLIQSQKSFGRGARREQNGSHPESNLGRRQSHVSRQTRHERRPATRQNLDDASLLVADFPKGEAQGLNTSPQPSLSGRPLPQVDMSTDDPRAQLIIQQHLATHNPQRKPKRLKTEQLPLETMPLASQTRSLALTIQVDGREFARLLARASQFDAWVADGKLRGVFEDGFDPGCTAALIEPLLQQLGEVEATMA